MSPAITKPEVAINAKPRDDIVAGERRHLRAARPQGARLDRSGRDRLARPAPT
jgi:hypothetical protein